MNRINLDDILLRADVSEVAQRLGMKIERRGGHTTAQCPFHDDRRPSLALYPRSGQEPSHFHCFACNAHGFALDLVKKVQGLTFRPAVEWLADSLGIQRSAIRFGSLAAAQSTREAALTFAERTFDHAHDANLFQVWCSERGYSVVDLFAIGLRCIPTGSPLLARLSLQPFGEQQLLIDGLIQVGLLTRLRPTVRIGAPQASLPFSEQFRDYFNDGRILIPIRSLKGELAGFAGRSISNGGVAASSYAAPKYLLSPGLKKGDILFNSDRVHASAKSGFSEFSSSALYVVEGFFDALRLNSLGLRSVAVMGTSISDAQRSSLISLVEEFQPSVEAYPTIRIFFDRDVAGFEGAVRTSRQLLGLPGVAVEWIGFGGSDSEIEGKDPDEILRDCTPEGASSLVNRHAFPNVGALIASNVGYKNATPLLDESRWGDIPIYVRERALVQVARAVRALGSGATNWIERFQLNDPGEAVWLRDLKRLLGAGLVNTPAIAGRIFESSFLTAEGARLSHARNLAEHGSRRGELPCDDEIWRVLDRNAEIFNGIALQRLDRGWRQTSSYDAVYLPRKLSSDLSILDDPRIKVMPHPADLHLQQLIVNELLTERHDFSHAGPRVFSDCIPAVRWFSTEGRTEVTGYVSRSDAQDGRSTPEVGEFDEPVRSFAYQIDMDVLEGRRPPSDQGMFRPYIECWRDFMSSLERQLNAIGSRVHVMRLDVKRYYDSIQSYLVRDSLLEPIEEAISVTGASALEAIVGSDKLDERAAAERIVEMICGGLFNYKYLRPSDDGRVASADIQGIPQGPVISAWIGTIVMFPVDAAADKFIRRLDQRQVDSSRPRAGYARYVDDIVLMADSEERLNALRATVQKAASALDLTLVRKGEPVIPGDPQSVMQQLNAGRALAPSVPVWEPPMIGDGETGWAVGDDGLAGMDRQSALHVLRHPDLLSNASKVGEKLKAAMRAPDLRPADLGKCARAVWWQVAEQAVSTGLNEWEQYFNAFLETWDFVCRDLDWFSALKSRGYDVLYAIEGLDMLLSSGPAIEKGRSIEWITRHRAALHRLSGVVVHAASLVVPGAENMNSAHIVRRARKVRWKALQRSSSNRTEYFAEAQKPARRNLADWLCHAAVLLRTAMPGAMDPLRSLPAFEDNPLDGNCATIVSACRYLKGTSRQEDGPSAAETALNFLVANTTDAARWSVLMQFPALLADREGGPALKVLPPIPVGQAGLMAYTDDAGPTQLIAFTASAKEVPLGRAVGAVLEGDRVDWAEAIELRWEEAEELAVGLHRFRGHSPIHLSFNGAKPVNRLRFAARLYEVFHSIQQQRTDEGKERVVVVAHVAHDYVPDGGDSGEASRWYLIADGVEKSLLGVTAWVRDGQGGLRSLSVPAGEFAHLWRLGCAVSDALEVAIDLREDSGADEEFVLTESHQIEDFILRQQLAKLRGAWISQAQVEGTVETGLPRTVRRALDILSRFDHEMELQDQVRLVLETECETRCMELRIKLREFGAFRDHIHQIPSLVLNRLPLSVLTGLPLPARLWEPLRSDFDFALGFVRALRDVDDSQHMDHIPSPPEAMLHISSVLGAASVALRGVFASAWGILRHVDTLPERLPIPQEWPLPEAGRQDPQREYDEICMRLRDDNWGRLQDLSPWQWLLALLGVLERIAPQVFSVDGDNPLRNVYLRLLDWRDGIPGDALATGWAWPFEDMPAYNAELWDELAVLLPQAVAQVDASIGVRVVNQSSPVFQRQRGSHRFVDADGRQWMLANAQYTSYGSTDSLARVAHRGASWPVWTEVRALADDELLSVHTIDDKFGSWQSDSSAQSVAGPDGSPASMSESHVPSNKLPGLPSATIAGISEWPGTRPDASSFNRSEDLDGRDMNGQGPKLSPEYGELDDYRISRLPHEVRESRSASWRARRAAKSDSHMRIALAQWCIDESYSHPISEVGLQGMSLKSRDLDTLRDSLNQSSILALAHGAAVRGNEHAWPIEGPSSIPSWPEHRRRRLLKGILDASHQLGVELLVLPEVSVRRETVGWLELELTRHYPGMAVLAGTYRHFGDSVADRGERGADVDVSPLMAPLTLLWRPDEKLSKALSIAGAGMGRTLRFWRGKKYRAVAAHEFFRPDWSKLRPLFSTESVVRQFLEIYQEGQLAVSEINALVLALVEMMPPLRYCLELICSELFLLTSPANLAPLRKEVEALLHRFPGGTANDATAIVADDHLALGSALTVSQENGQARRSILLVPSATLRSNDYWHAGQASVLASGTATVFCNAARSSFSCGGSCFIGVDSATKAHGDYAGMIDALTPYHGWRKGILQANGTGALSEADQALVVVDVDPVHVVTGKPRPQLLPEPMSLVAYLPLVEMIDAKETKAGLFSELSNLGEEQFKPSAPIEDITSALARVGEASTGSRPRPAAKVWGAFDALLETKASDHFDSPALDRFAECFSDARAVRDRLLVWAHDRHQQPNSPVGARKLEPAWLDFLDIDLSLKVGQGLPLLSVPRWKPSDESP